MQTSTRGLLDQLTYTVDPSHAVGDDQVLAVVRAVLAGRAYRESPATYLAAIEDALRDPAPIARPHENEQHLRAFLTDLRAQLERAQPWPVPAFQSLPVTEHADLLRAPVVLRVELRHREITSRLNEPFRPAGSDPAGEPQLALVLALTGGPTVALTAPAQPGVFPVQVRARDTDAALVQRALRSATGLDSEPA